MVPESMFELDDIEREMVQSALREHAVIYPCSNKNSLRECFTRDRSNCLFWFNTIDNSTHVLRVPLGIAS